MEVSVTLQLVLILTRFYQNDNFFEERNELGADKLTKYRFNSFMA